jgi:tetratricopeptide (TPR) repeat protein
MKKIISLVVGLCFALFSYATENQLIIAKANKAYADGLFTNAADLYKQVLNSGNESWELYYNLGNTFYKMNDFASAILYYEKAKKLNPGNDDINFNLKVTSNKIADKIEPLPEMFYKRWYRNLIELFPVDDWARIIILTFVLSLFFALFYVMSQRIYLRKMGFWAGILFFTVSLIAVHFSIQNYKTQQNNTEAIIFTPTVTIKSSPDEKSIDLFVLHEGTKVQILDNIGNWYEIRIANGSVGWLPIASLEKI